VEQDGAVLGVGLDGQVDEQDLMGRILWAGWYAGLYKRVWNTTLNSRARWILINDTIEEALKMTTGDDKNDNEHGETSERGKIPWLHFTENGKASCRD
jgi:hypothetical protein